MIMTKWKVYLRDGRELVVSSRYYFRGSKTRDHIFDNFDSHSWNEDIVARFNPDGVVGAVRI